jgi:hypothetical protein
LPDELIIELREMLKKRAKEFGEGGNLGLSFGS